MEATNKITEPLKKLKSSFFTNSISKALRELEENLDRKMQCAPANDDTEYPDVTDCIKG